MSKHTPGPWEAERVYLTIKDPTMRITANDGALYVAEAVYSHTQQKYSIHVTDADEMRANARLIAAAPELLQELKHAVVHEYNPFEPDNQSERYYRWAALIAKAEGQ
jgi:hypothetical protein